LRCETRTTGPATGFVDFSGKVPSEGCQHLLVDVQWFVDRVTAAGIAVEAGQVEAPRWGPELFSEDLW